MHNNIWLDQLNNPVMYKQDRVNWLYFWILFVAQLSMPASIDEVEIMNLKIYLFIQNLSSMTWKVSKWKIPTLKISETLLNYPL